MQSNPLWAYSLRVYGIERVREIVLGWQDNYGCDVNMLLCCCWLGSQQQRLDETQLGVLLEAGAQWRAQCLLPLRSVRRFVREQAAGDLLYRQLKDAEISAEQWHQQRLFVCIESFGHDLARASASADAAGMDNLQMYCQFLNGVQWSDLAEEAIELLTLLKR
jgi:uncharacterized protein (TIGR02444 family)